MTTFKTVTINGTWEMTLPLHRAERPEWFTDEGWEKKRLEKLHEVIKPDDLVFYVGAEEGEMAALCQMWGARVFLFEPNEKVWPNIRAVWGMNHLDPPYGSFVGFSSNKTDLKGSEIYYKQYPIAVHGPIIPDHGFKELYDEGDHLPQIKLDDLCINKNIVPQIISIDCEGSEMEILKGAESTLRSFHPTLFISWHAEFMFRMYGVYLAEARKWLIDIGYEEVFIEYPLHELHMMYIKK